MSSQVVPPVTHPTPFVLRITQLPVGRQRLRSSRAGFTYPPEGFRRTRDSDY